MRSTRSGKSVDTARRKPAGRCRGSTSAENLCRDLGQKNLSDYSRRTRLQIALRFSLATGELERTISLNEADRKL